MTVVLIVAYSVSVAALVFAAVCMVDTHRILRDIDREQEQWDRVMGRL